MTIRVLVTGDIHLGKRPTRVLDTELAERASAAKMWEAIVSRAIKDQVDAVMLTGDIVDHENRFYEATGPLERGIQKLAEARIHTFAVAGNHDWDVFPRILKNIDYPYFHFLGQGGKWSEKTIEKDGKTVLKVVGWSFPSQHYLDDPLKLFPYPKKSSIPTIGLIHGDLDNTASKYAPINSQDLKSHENIFWALGHIHKPQFWKRESILYPGSPQALNPSEKGPHGPWMIEFNEFQVVNCSQLPMTLIRYEECEVKLDSAKTKNDFDVIFSDSISKTLEHCQKEDSPLELLLLQVNFIGYTELYGDLEDLTSNIADLERSNGKIRAKIERHQNNARPHILLEEFLKQSGPIGDLARIINGLEKNIINESLSQILSNTLSRLQEAHKAPVYDVLRTTDPAPDRDLAKKLLLTQGRRLLEHLVSQGTIKAE